MRLQHPLQKPTLPSDATEPARQRLLAHYGILDSAPETLYDDLAGLAASICETPLAAITFFDGERQWYKSMQGADITETSLADSFCTYTAEDPNVVLAVGDALSDTRFAHLPVVTQPPNLQAYAGASLIDLTNVPLGTICVFDVVKRSFSQRQLQALAALSRQVVSLLQLRRRIVDLERRGRQLSLVNRELDQFGYIVTHDLKAPIRQQNAFAQVIQEDYADQLPDDVKVMLEQMRTIGQRADAILDDINVYLRNSTLDRSQIEHIDVESLFASIDPLLSVEPGHTVTFKNELPEDITVPAAPMRHVLSNLINNGLKFCDKDGPCVEVTATQEDHKVLFVVSDNGPGIAPEERERIFEVFGRGEQAKRAPGRGLGLAIAQRLVRSLDGKITVRNQADGGACFRVSLPIS